MRLSQAIVSLCGELGFGLTRRARPLWHEEREYFRGVDPGVRGSPT